MAGDSAQHTDASVCFSSWKEVLNTLGVEASAPIELKTNYRCPLPVSEFAHQVLGPLAPAERPRALRDGLPVGRTLVANLAHAAVIIGEALDELLLRERLANVAIVTRTAETARELYEVLRHAVDLDLIQHGEFSFGPGIEICEVSQVKGLEFDYVILPDLSPSEYGTDPLSRHTLHVAATRAIHQLWVISLVREPEILSPSQAMGPS